MRRLLTKQNQRFLDLVEFLFERDWTTIDAFLSTGSYSERTVRSDIQSLNQLLEPVQIITSFKTGIRLVIPPTFSIKYCYSKIMSEEPNIVIMESLFTNQYDSILALGDATFISPSTVRKSLQQINEVIQEYDFSISLTSLKIEGDEQQILSFYRTLFVEKYNGELPLDKELFSKVKTSIKSFYQQVDLNYFSFNLNVVALYVLIRIIRMQQSSDNIMEKRLASLVEVPGVNELNQELSELANLGTTHDFYSEIWRYTDGKQFFLKFSSFMHGVKEIEAVGKEYEHLSILADRINESLGIELTEREHFIFKLYTINLRDQHLSSIIFDEVAIMLTNFKKVSPYFYVKLEMTIQEFVVDYPGMTVENLLYNTLSAWDNFWSLNYLIQPKMRVALYSNFNNLAFLNNRRVIQKEFQYQIEATLIDPDTCESIESFNEKFDLLIVDVSNYQSDGMETLCIPYDITRRDFSVIEEAYERYVLKLVKNQQDEKQKS